MCHVLIIEDDALAAMEIRETVAHAGAASFDFADTEQEAIARARLSRPAVIISDVMLSTGFGPDAVRGIRAELGDIPAIFITGTPELCTGCDPQMIIEKPFSPRRLASMFEAVRPS